MCRTDMTVLEHQGWFVGILNELSSLIPVGSQVDYPFARDGAAPISQATRSRLGIDKKEAAGTERPGGSDKSNHWLFYIVTLLPCRNQVSSTREHENMFPGCKIVAYFSCSPLDRPLIDRAVVIGMGPFKCYLRGLTRRLSERTTVCTILTSKYLVVDKYKGVTQLSILKKKRGAESITFR